jgi:hypothetical protein
MRDGRETREVWETQILCEASLTRLAFLARLAAV